MNRLTLEKRVQIIHMLCEGNSIRATSRMADVSKNTVVKLLVDVGTACREYQDETLRGLSCKRIQCDEIWGFCYCKEKNTSEEQKGILGFGDVWTWTGMDADSKLMVSFHVGRRDPEDAHAFTQDLVSRIATRVQLTAIEDAFGMNVDYAMLIKLYGGSGDTDKPKKRYSPATCTGAEKRPISGKPDKDHISTSFIERQNLTMRMNMRRFTRLTNAFSKKVENLEYAVALHFMYYNFARIHQTLRCTPAMQAGVADHVWEIEEIVKLADSK